MSTPLDYYLTELHTLTSVGSRRRNFYKKLVGNRFIDLLWHLPSNLCFRKLISHIHEAPENALVTFEATVELHQPGLRKRSPYRIWMRDNKNNRFEILFFNAYDRFLQRVAPEGRKIAISGQLKCDRTIDANRYQMSHPDFMGGIDEIGKWIGPERVYGLTAGLTRAMVINTIDQVLKSAYELPEWICESQMVEGKFPSFLKALKKVHRPQDYENLGFSDPARQRLIFDEFLAYHLGMAISHRRLKPQTFSLNQYTPKLAKQLEELLPFSLTNAQISAIAELRSDMQKGQQMVRLLQGDVGSGKTLVAVMAALDVADMGQQTAILVPTEILSRQHALKIREMLMPLGLEVALLTGREKGKTREGVIKTIRSGNATIVVGTHALLEESVEFKNLGLVVIDEQHRFGVEQRLALTKKSKTAHILSMTATPIPRTLVLANHGDMDVSILNEKPVGRKTIQTRVISVDRLTEVVEQLQAIMNKGRQVYWVCPLIEESEKSDFAAAVARYDMLKEIFGTKVELMHGRMKGPEKDAAMQRFISGEATLLVSTTVIEVGVDVPQATVMVIEHAQRFGLAQLHQLRGRVGRNDIQSFCLLLYGQPLSFQARKRLETMRDCHDGFKIAEEDLRLRGGGEIIGTKQSGVPKFRLCDLVQEDPADAALLEGLFAKAHSMANEALKNDPDLASEQGLALRQLLILAEYDNAQLLKKSG
jgi:ATP-dependent DNA helicase RecG